jgi:hypothetical protein
MHENTFMSRHKSLILLDNKKAPFKLMNDDFSSIYQIVAHF